MTQGIGTVFDPDTIALLKKVFTASLRQQPKESETLCDYERPDLFRSKSDTPVPLLPPHRCGKRGGRTVEVRPN